MASGIDKLGSKRNKLTLARMTHGDIIKKNDALYITDYKDTKVQNLINIYTGSIMQKVLASPWNNKCKDSIFKLEGDLILVIPQIGLDDYAARVYSERGNCIFVLNNTRGVGVWSRLLNDENVLVILRDQYKNNRAFVWNPQLQKITEYYDGVTDVYTDSKEGIIRINQLTDDDHIINHSYTIDIMEMTI